MVSDVIAKSMSWHNVMLVTVRIPIYHLPLSSSRTLAKQGGAPVTILLVHLNVVGRCFAQSPSRFCLPFLNVYYRFSYRWIRDKKQSFFRVWPSSPGQQFGDSRRLYFGFEKLHTLFTSSLAAFAFAFAATFNSNTFSTSCFFFLSCTAHESLLSLHWNPSLSQLIAAGNGSLPDYPVVVSTICAKQIRRFKVYLRCEVCCFLP